MIDHLNLVVADLERSAAFYEGVFGFKRGFSAILHGEWFETVTQIAGARAQCLFLENPSGGARIELIRYDFPFPNSQKLGDLSPAASGLRHFALEVEDLELTLEKVREMGVVPLSAPVEVPFAVGNLGRKWLCYLRDPDGVLVEIAAYRP
jgi:catechol 2,3-dioxygenase-like lactoylglutathione lyase family enzyme